MNDETTQLILIPDQPLELSSGWATLAELAHEVVPEPPRTLLDNIRRFGLLQPILVRETMADGSADGNHWDDSHTRRDLVFGRRRLACCRALGIDPIPAFVVETDLAIADVMTLAENALRTNNRITEFQSIKRLIAEGASIKDISGATGMSQQTIKARQRLLRLDDGLMEAFERGLIASSVAENIAKLPVVLQKRLVETFAEEGRITAADVHEVRLAQQQAVSTPMLDLDFGADDDGEEIDARVEEPSEELALADELQAMIPRLPKAHPVLARSLAWVAAILTDLAAGQAVVMVEPEEFGIPIRARAMTADERAVFTEADITRAAKGVTDRERDLADELGLVVIDGMAREKEEHFVAGFDLAVEGGAMVVLPGPDARGNYPLDEEEPDDLDTSDQEPYPAELADDERYPLRGRDVIDDLFG